MNKIIQDMQDMKRKDKLQRKKQNIVLYFLTILFPLAINAINASMLLDLGNAIEEKIITAIITFTTGFIVTAISDRMLASSWK